MLFTVLAWITGLAGPISTIAGKIVDLQTAKLAAQTDEERARLDQSIQESHDRRAEIIAEAGSRFGSFITSSLRFIIAIGPAAYLTKVFLWDKVIGAFNGCVGQTGTDCNLFSTDPLDSNLWFVVLAVIAFYLSYDIAARLRK